MLSGCSGLKPVSVDNNLPPVEPEDSQEVLCPNEWFQYVEGQVGSSDNLGHGPDVGSLEWQSVIEFKLGLVKQAKVPAKSTAQWCEYIQQVLDERRIIPTLYCQADTLNSMDKALCSEPSLVKVDHEMNKVFRDVLAKLNTKKRAELKAEQREWLKNREHCLQSNEQVQCIRDHYQYRIAELQSSHGLVEGLGPIYYVCDGELTDEVAVRFFPTEPPSLIAERAGQASFMTLRVSASGAKYQGQDNIFWEHQGNAYITWGSDADMMDCKKMH